MNGLAVKEVAFNGDMLQAMEDLQHVVWVGVKRVCEGIGFTKSQKDTQIQKLQKDSTLNEGCLKFQAGVFDPNNETLGIQLDYLPLWLAKISITPKMRTETPEIAGKLKLYQLQAKDVLAREFWHNENTIDSNLVSTITSMCNAFATVMPTINVMQNQLTSIVTSMQEQSAKTNEMLLTLVENSQPKKKFQTPFMPAWTSNMYPKFQELKEHYFPDDSGLKNTYALIFKEVNKYYPGQLSQVEDDFRYKNNCESCYTMDAVAYTPDMREGVEQIVDAMIEEMKPIDEIKEPEEATV